MNVQIEPQSLRGTVRAIPSKSDAHRALICAALADDKTLYSRLAKRLTGAGAAEDLLATVQCLDALLSDQQPVCLDCRESGSTLRFLLPVAAAVAERTRLTGTGRLPFRPLGELRTQMERHGVQFSAEQLPFEITGRLTGGTYTLPGNISSQYVTGLLLALPLLPDDSQLTLTTPLESAAYVEMTLKTLQAFGIRIQPTKDGFLIPGRQHYHAPDALEPEGDWSNAAFFLTAGMLGSGVELLGLSPDSVQADRAILSCLADFGAEVNATERSVCVASTPSVPKKPCRIDVSSFPDLFPILAVAACAVDGETHLVNAARLRLKESDRIASTAAMITALGGHVTEAPDALTIHGTGHLNGGTVSGMGDHRIVMAAAIASMLCSSPVQILGAEAVQKSYPLFFEDFQQLGGNVHVV